MVYFVFISFVSRYFFYTKSCTYEHVPFLELVYESNLAVSPAKLASIPSNAIGYMALYYNRFTVFFMQIIHKDNQTHTDKKRRKYF